MTKKVTRYGQEFTFDDDTDQKVIDRRIESWMKQNAPDKLPASPTPAPPAASSTDDGTNYLPKSNLARIARIATAATPLGPLMAIPGVSEAVNSRLGDVNFYRTFGQGVIPLADEGVAKIRSLIPQSWGGTDYDTALAAERQGVKDYADKHGNLESIALQGAGALATIPLTMGAGALLQGTRGGLMAANLASKLPMAGRAAEFAANSPKWAQLIKNTAAGAGLGAAGGFAGGEGGVENRLENAGYGALFGTGAGLATTGVGKLLEHGKNVVLSKNNSVADYLRKRLQTDRSDAYGLPNAVPRRPNGTIDTTHPDFANAAANDLKTALAEQRANAAISVPGPIGPQQKGRDVMMADVLPGTTEAVSLKGGEDTANLAKDIVRRQYNKTLPEDLARDESQHGLVSNWFKRLMGDANFRGTEDQMLKHRAQEALTGFQPAYAQNVTSPEILDAYRRASQLHPDVVGTARTWAQTQRGGPRQIGTFDADGNIIDLNVQHLHDIKRSLDLLAKTEPKFNTKNTFDIRNDLNEAIMNSSDPYKQAMRKYGEESQLIDALRKGREDVFGKGVNELDQGIGKQDIEAFLADPNISDAAKDMFRIGGQRALYQKLVGSDASKFQTNWADIMNKPNLAEKYKALVPPDKMGEWDQMRKEMMQLEERHSNAARALAGSQTARRGEMSKEFDDPSVLSDIVATVVNPSAPSTWRHWVGRLTDRGEASKATANAVAKLLAMKGERGNQDAVEAIREILSKSQRNKANWNTGINRTAKVLPYSGVPGSERHYVPQESDRTQ